MTRIASWNVNGIRAAEGKGLFQWLQEESPDILCLQETKISLDQLSEAHNSQPGYTSYFRSAKKRGYSGVAVYAKEAPLSVSTLGISEFDDEGRTLILEYPEFTLINAYFPNSQEEGARLPYKLAFCEAVLRFCKNQVKVGRHIVICGDFNIAHKPIDLANPKSNEKNPGYLPEERAWMDTFTSSGFVDTFRMFCAEAGHYSWWSYRFNARSKNIGWRIDYFCTDSGFTNRIESSKILPEVTGSDHCPVLLQIG
jgi:exodeoxyribonuclease-3